VSRLGRQAQARNQGRKGVLLSRSPHGLRRPRFIPRAALAMPIQSTCPQPWGERVGGVSGRPTRASGEERSSSRARRRNGERHSDSRDVGSLRGRSGERGSWSVRHVCLGLVPRRLSHRRQRGALWDAEEGNVVGMRKAHALFVKTPKKALSTLEDTSFARSRGPCASIVTKLSRRKPREVTRSVRYRGRANLRKQEETGTGVGTNGRMRGSPLVTALPSAA